MRLKRVYIQEYKNLREFECLFSESNISAFIGNNGSGKSNLLEVITRAFGAAKNYAEGKGLTLIAPHTRPSVLNCVVDYQINGVEYSLRYNTNVEDLLMRLNAEVPEHVTENIEIVQNGKKLTKKQLPTALPASILLYYAGETLRQKGVAEETYDSIYEEKLKKAQSADLPGLRFMDYYSAKDLPMLLVTASAYRGLYMSRLLSFLRCTDIAPKFSIILQAPPKGRGAGDTYWGATGFVKHFLDGLRKHVSMTRDEGNQYYMFFDNAEILQHVSQDEFDLFAKLKALKHYGYLYHVGLNLVNTEGVNFSSTRLSEGEKQLSLLLLLTAFTARHECLYLFDEFDSYLHLNWQRMFAKNIVNSEIKGHMLFTTHSPATLSQIQQDDLFILKNGIAMQSGSNTYNRSLNEIMEEQMEVSMRPVEYTELVREFRNAVVHGTRSIAQAKLDQIREVIDDDDPFFITARIVLERMEDK